ncbi:unnamed protein product [Discosporangium mesarthrocarpum]
MRKTFLRLSCWQAILLASNGFCPCGPLRPTQQRTMRRCGWGALPRFPTVSQSLVAGRPSTSTRPNAGLEDRFRPARASTEPMVINTLVKVLFHGAEAATAVEDLLEERKAINDELTSLERETVVGRVCGVAGTLAELRFILATAVDRNPFIAKYGMEAEYGLGDDLESNPLTQMNHVESLLALFILHKEGRGAPVDFVDGEKLLVLRG